jgi:SlyX protein
MTDETLEKIETKIAFLERANTELSDVVFRQQRAIDVLSAQMTALESRLQTSYDADATPRSLEDERPPHY